MSRPHPPWWSLYLSFMCVAFGPSRMVRSGLETDQSWTLVSPVSSHLTGRHGQHDDTNVKGAKPPGWLGECKQTIACEAAAWGIFWSYV